MTYQIHITKTAERDLVGAADCIEFTIKNPSAADNLLDKAEEKISELSSFPEVHAVVDDLVLSAWGIRFTVINNFFTPVTHSFGIDIIIVVINFSPRFYDNLLTFFHIFIRK